MDCLRLAQKGSIGLRSGEYSIFEIYQRECYENHVVILHGEASGAIIVAYYYRHYK